MRRMISMLMAVLLVVSIPLTALAAEYDIANGSITITADESGQTVEQGSNKVADDAPVITGTSTTNTVTVNAEEGSTANVTLQDVNISASSSVKVDADKNATVNLELDGDNEVKNVAKSSDAGELVIQDANSDGGSLTATSSGSNAAIGSTMGNDVSNITINSGTVTATSSWGAAIGAGEEGDASYITINGGTVSANSGWGAAIGAGQDGDASNITINGGTVTATSSNYGAAIGAGQNGDASKIAINGGTINATASYGAAIGSGQYGNADGIEIDGATVNVTGSFGAAIGAGQNGDATNITITDSVVTATTGKVANGNKTGGGAAIGGGQHGDASKITISDSTVTATTNYGGAAIGGGQGTHQGVGGNATNIQIDGGTVNATASYGAAAIGGGGNRNNNEGNDGGNSTDILITGDAIVTATSTAHPDYGHEGAAIGGGGGKISGTGSDITISERAQVTTNSDGNDFGGGKGQVAVEPNTDGLYNTGSVNGVNGTVEDPNAPPAPAPEPEYTPVYTPTPAPTEPEEPEVPEAPAQVEVKVDTAENVVIDLAAGTQDGKPMEKIEAEVEIVAPENTETAEPVVIPADTTIVINKVEIAAEEKVEEVSKEEVGMVFTVACIQENVVTNLPGTVKLSIPAPEFDMGGYVLVFVNADGEQIEVPYKIVDGKLVFETEFVGLYMIVKK